MKKFLISVFIVSFLSVLYVFQQATLLEESYNIHSKQKSLFLLVDHNRELRYNVAKLERPARLETILIAQQIDLYMPRTWHKIRVNSEEEKLAISQEQNPPAGPFIGAGKIIMSMFSLDTEAIAKEVAEKSLK